MTHVTYALNSIMVLAQQEQGGPLGPEHGKASPIGLFILVALLAAVLWLGWAFHRRYSEYTRRRAFAEKHGLDVFDTEAVDKAMAEAGVADHRKKHFF